MSNKNMIKEKQRMKYKRKINSVVAFLILAFVNMIPFQVQAGEMTTDTKVVKVAYILSPGFQEGREGEYKSGQGYEYLQKIAGYTGWTYEYVYGDFEELLQMLVDGEIDLMGNLSYTEDRAQYISYGQYEQGRETFYLYVNGNSDIQADNLDTLNGKKIGVSKGSYQEALWKLWCEEKSVKCDLVEFNSKVEREEALNYGIIDASLGSLMPNRNAATKDWKSVFSFGDAPYYFAVNKNKPELLKELDKAQGKILNDDPYYNEDLMKRYLPNGVLSQSQLDTDELRWLENYSAPIKVGCLDDFLPISDMDEEGHVKGVILDVFEEIQNNFQSYNMEYEMVVYQDYEQMIKDLKSGKIDIAAPVYGDYWYADQEGISLTRAFMTTTMLYLQYGKHSEAAIKKLGIDKQNPFQIEYAKIYYPDCEQILYSTMEEVSKALKKGKIDAGLSTACNYHVKAILYKDLGDINRSTLPNDIAVTMAVAKNNPDLMSLINRGLYSVGDTVVYNSMAKNSSVEKKVTLADYISENPKQILLMVCIFTVFVSMVIIALIIIVIRLRRANKRASVDSMTGLLNKNSMSDRVKEKLPLGGVFFMIDIDNFKKINDELGHETGDRVIIYFANALQKIFRSEDLIGRFGGDEFMIFLPGKDLSEALIKNKVDQIQKDVAACEIFRKHKAVAEGTVSIGVVILNADNKYSYNEVFKKADNALYEAKNKGRNTFVISKYE